MRRKYTLKKHADNEFTAITGIEAILIMNGSNCLVVRKMTADRCPIQRYSYCLYSNNKLFYKNPYIKVTSSCGVLNCVRQNHLTATYEPTTKDNTYILEHLKIEGHEQLAHIKNIPLALFLCKYPK